MIVNYSLEIKACDKLLINSTYLAEPLLKEIYKAALKAGVHPELKISLNGTEKIFYDNASDEQLKYVSPASWCYTENYDAFLHVLAPFDVKELQDVEPVKLQTATAARAELKKTYVKRWAEGSLNWTLCMFPTESAAGECGMSLAEFEEFVYSACHLYQDDPISKWKQVHEQQQHIADYLTGKDNIRYVGPDIDITFSSKERKWINCDGHRNMPDGEIFTSPVEDSVNGNVRFSYPGIYLGKEIEDITLEVKAGEVVKWDAAKGKELLDKIFEIEGARRFGEAAVGTNTGIDKFTKSILFDEKIAGTIHMAVGSAPPITGGKNESAIHWDMIADMHAGQIYADNELIYENGRFII
ncbi:MAG: aminopeptidase [Sedimentisphaerales bacterium]|nr:aminopeptidase [Sedimentisphaerales bacterium]